MFTQMPLARERALEGERSTLGLGKKNSDVFMFQSIR
jgi:hypothetical protein